MTQRFFFTKMQYGYKNAEFYAEFKCFELVLKNAPAKVIGTFVCEF